jgi:hypothetical protein
MEIGQRTIVKTPVQFFHNGMPFFIMDCAGVLSLDAQITITECGQ